MYKKYLTFLFLKKIFYVLITFYCLIFILNLFEEISFFKDLPINKFELIIITFLNIHSTIFLIFPFIFLIAVQLFFIEINEKYEFDLLKVNGLTNLKVISIIGVISFFLGIIILITFYNISAKLKFLYLNTKNSFSADDKYLAVINENGLWIKDNVSNMQLIINAKKINNDTIEDVIINVFDEQFRLKKTIKSKTANIKDNNWKLDDTVIFVDNQVIEEKDKFLFYSNFTIERISRLFKDLSSLNLIELLKLRVDYKNLNYDSDEVDLYLKKIFVFPLQVTIMSLISSILMLNIKKTKSYTGYLLIGILSSVIIYYMNMIFSVLATSKIIPVNLSIFIPMFIIFCFTLMGFIRINEK
jgi:lipopolysaccharide export system permease protein